MATPQQQFYDKVYDSARRQGANDVQAHLAASQSSLETGYGKSLKGNSYFGVKAGKNYTGDKVNFVTNEAHWDKAKKDAFRAYDGLDAAVKDYLGVVQRNWPAAFNAKTVPAAVKGLKNGLQGGYATGKKGDKGKSVNNSLNWISNKFGENATTSFVQKELANIGPNVATPTLRGSQGQDTLGGDYALESVPTSAYYPSVTQSELSPIDIPGSLKNAVNEITKGAKGAAQSVIDAVPANEAKSSAVIPSDFANPSGGIDVPGSRPGVAVNPKMSPMLNTAGGGQSKLTKKNASSVMSGMIDKQYTQMRSYYESMTGKDFPPVNDAIAKAGTSREKSTKGSQHFRGGALDISTKGMSNNEKLALVEAARRSGFNGIGLGPTITHVDIRPNAATWQYNKGAKTWAGVDIKDLRSAILSNQVGNRFGTMAKGMPTSKHAGGIDGIRQQYLDRVRAEAAPTPPGRGPRETQAEPVGILGLPEGTPSLAIVGATESGQLDKMQAAAAEGMDYETFETVAELEAIADPQQVEPTLAQNQIEPQQNIQSAIQQNQIDPQQNIQSAIQQNQIEPQQNIQSAIQQNQIDPQQNIQSAIQQNQIAPQQQVEPTLAQNQISPITPAAGQAPDQPPVGMGIPTPTFRPEPTVYQGGPGDLTQTQNTGITEPAPTGILGLPEGTTPDQIERRVADNPGFISGDMPSAYGDIQARQQTQPTTPTQTPPMQDNPPVGSGAMRGMENYNPAIPDRGMVRSSYPGISGAQRDIPIGPGVTVPTARPDRASGLLGMGSNASVSDIMRAVRANEPVGTGAKRGLENYNPSIPDRGSVSQYSPVTGDQFSGGQRGAFSDNTGSGYDSNQSAANNGSWGDSFSGGQRGAFSSMQTEPSNTVSAPSYNPSFTPREEVQRQEAAVRQSMGDLRQETPATPTSGFTEPNYELSPEELMGVYGNTLAAPKLDLDWATPAPPVTTTSVVPGTVATKPLDNTPLKEDSDLSVVGGPSYGITGPGGNSVIDAAWDIHQQKELSRSAYPKEHSTLNKLTFGDLKSPGGAGAGAALGGLLFGPLGAYGGATLGNQIGSFLGNSKYAYQGMNMGSSMPNLTRGSYVGSAGNVSGPGQYGYSSAGNSIYGIDSRGQGFTTNFRNGVGNPTTTFQQEGSAHNRQSGGDPLSKAIDSLW